jgi:hypothetical protein
MDETTMADLTTLAKHYGVTRSKFVRYALLEAIIWFGANISEIRPTSEVDHMLAKTDEALRTAREALDSIERRIQVTRNLL